MRMFEYNHYFCERLLVYDKGRCINYESCAAVYY